MISISLFGNPSVTQDGTPLRGFVSAKAAALVYYLAATAQPHARESLAGLLWPDADEQHASKNLRDVLSNLRKLLGTHLLITRQSAGMTSHADVEIDVRNFEAHLQAARQASNAADLLRAAVALYHGDFLEGFSLADAPAFEEWVLVERERLRRMVIDALSQLAADATEHGDYQNGITYASRLLTMDPLHEASHRQLMLLLALSGQRAAALAQYETYRRLLDDELGLDPDEETEALYRRMLDGQIVGVALAPLPARPVYNLPTPLGTFIDRASELAQIVAYLRDPDCRLVTIVGIGGAGKTRLALQAAHQLLPASQHGEIFAHGIVFVGLAALEPDAWPDIDEQAMRSVLASRVADALHCSFAGEEAPLMQLTDFLREKDVLLVIDNCEHLPSIAPFLVTLLEEAPQLKMLATSRGHVLVRGERIIELDGLPFPQQASAIKQDSWNEYGAVQLFRQTAQAVHPRLAWTTADVRAAVRVCELVNGLPLGIELAASMARLLPCEEIAREIAGNVTFLHSVQRDLPARHQSLRAVFEHSWRLLTAEEQQSLRRLSVFQGGFSRDAAQQVAGASFAQLATLVNNSLVRRVASADNTSARYELLELVRHHAAERLADMEPSAGEQTLTCDRHSQYYLTLLDRHRAAIQSSRQQEAIADMHREIENVRRAWRWAIKRDFVQLLDNATDALFDYYEIRSRFQEGGEVFAEAAQRLEHAHAATPNGESQRIWAKVLARQGWFAYHIGQHGAAEAMLRRSIELLRPLASPAELIFPLSHLAVKIANDGMYDTARQLADEALRAARAGGDQRGIAVTETVLSQIAFSAGDYEAAERHARQSLAVEQTIGNEWGIAFTLMSLGRVAQMLAKHQEAQRYLQEALVIRQRMKDARGTALCLLYLGDTAAALAEHAAATWCYRESLALFKESGERASTATALTKLGYNALAGQQRSAALATFREALQIAWSSNLLAHTLAALAGIANALIATEPAFAADLARFVRDYAATTPDVRAQAMKALQPPEASREQSHALTLETAVSALLASTFTFKQAS
ncbi:MAG TPA: BTAD domain-containing putative transcriptional regulator [Roseiflexaceae bacterium]|nr:BTAD domain-containing putative transcriptional regulator [Roseiflexaceae bacterium]